MRYIFVDFEMNPIAKKYREERKHCGKEIIEIGAVMLDEDLKETSSFRKYVKPEYNSTVDNRYEDLTGIGIEMLAGADNFEKAFCEFMAWCGSDGYQIYAWSNSDKLQVEREMCLKGFEETEEVRYMFCNWIDFQKEFGEMISAERAVSLEDALNICGIAFSGKKHDALYDARNTSLLYAEAKTNNVAANIKEIKGRIGSEPMMTAIGDLFNFSELKF
ncbi:MAG: 3'-5' exonuclease [Schaedlerella sp.]|nr:exonuclease domain-containing protein [Lachnospiraceae bacterium]MDY4201469.1 3'-5' exonuclease [Schaedlerella sp.]